MILCVIPARGGSKRIPKKNIKDFHGRPMISWSIRAALESKLFDHTIVSTDDKEIASIALNEGAEVPFTRPQYLALDDTPTKPVVKHAVQQMEQLQNKKISVACCVYATAPFLSGFSLVSAFKQFTNNSSVCLFSCATYAFPIQRAFELGEESRCKVLFPEDIPKRSQDLPETYHDAGQFYFGDRNFWLSDEPLIASGNSGFVLPRHSVQDIDTMEDWDFAERLFKIRNFV